MSNLRGPSQAPDRPAAPLAAAHSPGSVLEPVAEAEDFASLDCGALELEERLDAGEEVVIVDVRAQVGPETLPGALHIPLAQLEARWQELAKADEVVCYDSDGSTSGRAARLLRGKGLINATSLEGGLERWRAIGGKTAPRG